MRITVRQATWEDLDSIVQVLGELQTPPTAVADPHAWTEMLGQTGRTILIAEQDGDPVGTADLWIAPTLLHGAVPRAFLKTIDRTPIGSTTPSDTNAAPWVSG